MENIDILLKNADWLITMNPERTLFQDGAVAIRQDRIVEVGKTEELAKRYESREELDCTGKLVLPDMRLLKRSIVPIKSSSLV